jgi:hypothetical protein
MVGVECDEDGELVWCSAPYAKLADVGAAPVCAVRVRCPGALSGCAGVATWQVRGKSPLGRARLSADDGTCRHAGCGRGWS